MHGPNEISTALREIVYEAEFGEKCDCCRAPHILIDRPKASRLGFKASTHKEDCLIGKLRVILGIPDTDFA